VSMMRFQLLIFFFITSTAIGQVWQAELMTGAAHYSGDLAENQFSIKRLRPGAMFNLRYFSGDFINVRAGFGWFRLAGHDKYNSKPALKNRNLSFQSNVFEFNVCGEMNILDPAVYYAYPYFFAGAGLFYFNPYTYDKDNKKIFLPPLSTEGQGLAEYPDRKKYSLVQFCIPLGFGGKLNFKDKWELGYEFGYRVIFTDYLDDVSKTYIDMEVLAARKGNKAVELAYRKEGVPFSETGEPRGNSSVRDSYFFSGVKLAVNLEQNKNKKKNTEKRKHFDKWYKKQ